jgi:light-regulated signal transduction histidine kinase (bacteriophytochrome)
MMAGEVYYCNLDQVPERDYSIYLKRKLLTYLDAPIYVNGDWWGIMGLDDNFRVRDWAAVELDAVKVAASTLSSAIQRQLRDEAFRKAEREHREELEQRVQERTRQLQDALQEIEGVSFTASHDLRAPLRAVNGYASILLNEYADSLTGEQVGYVQKIKQASQRMARLLDDLIRLIRYSRQPIRRQEVDLSDLARRALRNLQEQYPRYAARVDIAPRLITYGDRALLDVVVTELLGNAWKFTENQPNPEIQFASMQQDGKTR